jgi:hypothetical protein
VGSQLATEAFGRWVVLAETMMSFALTFILFIIFNALNTASSK